MHLYVEKAYPYVMAIAASSAWYICDGKFPIGNDVLSASLTIGAILTGFLATAKTLLMTLDTPVMNRIRDTSYASDLASYLGAAIWLCFGFCVLAMVGYFCDTASKWYGVAWMLVAISASLAFVRVTSIMLKIIKHQPSKGR
ncbi:hypothetical protein K6U17_18075 [Vibrio fluvialis]|uniref:hypothetical protein n=1 Tax=Vibrio fluvialis TaxID=676 RepID=UPI001EEC7B33|nr:hypothetical protein [Vibrio fluvialis]MCG6411117.1 hypothetical protein [Vibrio fluvialis]